MVPSRIASGLVSDCRRRKSGSKRVRAGMDEPIPGGTALGRAFRISLVQTMVTTRRRQWVLSLGEQVLTVRWTCRETCGNGLRRCMRAVRIGVCCAGGPGTTLQTSRDARAATATIRPLGSTTTGFVVRGNFIDNPLGIDLPPQV